MSEPKTTSEATTARRLVRGIDSGILSTMSQELPGYPFGSVTPYAMTHEGQVTLFVSKIAQHANNMRENAKVCLTVAAKANESENPQALGRVTIVGDAHPVPEDRQAAVGERYFGFFPEARGYGGAHDFLFYWIEPRRVRFIGGFGQIYWVEEADWFLPTPAWSSDEGRIVEHMNDDHTDALLKIARHHGRPVDSATLVSLDPEGFHLRSDSGLRYVSFPEPCFTTDEVRTAMIDLTRRELSE